MYTSKLQSEAADNLIKAFMCLKSNEEYYRFLDDLCTIKEIKDLVQRFDVAQLLNDGLTFNEIADKTGASTATITRVNKCLKYGSDGYLTVLKRINKNSK